MSSEVRVRVLTSVRWPGRSREYTLLASRSSSFDFVGGGTLYTSMAFDARAKKSYDHG
jgi:hypothetical protein